MHEQLGLWNKDLDTQARWADGCPDIDQMLTDLEPRNIYSTRSRAGYDLHKFLIEFTGQRVVKRMEYLVTLETASWKFYFQ